MNQEVNNEKFEQKVVSKFRFLKEKKKLFRN